MNNIYSENILDHFRNPKNFGRLEKPDATHKEVNPLCGDEFEVQIKLNGNSIKEIKFNGEGCAISTASMSMLTEKVKEMEISEIKNLQEKDVLEILKIPITPIRMKCAMLPLVAVKNVLEKIQI